MPPWETPYRDRAAPRPASDRLARASSGTKDSGGSLRGIFDYRDGQVATLASITDGTSNTFLVGERLPNQGSAGSLWALNGSSGGTTIPINWRTDQNERPGMRPGQQCELDELGTAGGSYGSGGFKSRHPGGANFVFCDGSVKFIKQTITLPIYCALGSRNGGEVISADAY